MAPQDYRAHITVALEVIAMDLAGVTAPAAILVILILRVQTPTDHWVTIILIRHLVARFPVRLVGPAHLVVRDRLAVVGVQTILSMGALQFRLPLPQQDRLLDLLTRLRSFLRLCQRHLRPGFPLLLPRGHRLVFPQNNPLVLRPSLSTKRCLRVLL